MRSGALLDLSSFGGGASGRRFRSVSAGAGGERSETIRPPSLLERVTLWRTRVVEGLLLPAAAKGTLVDLSTRGDFGTVEFDWPLHAVVALPLAELRRL